MATTNPIISTTNCKCPHAAELNKTPSELLFDKIVTVKVGPRKKEYLVHKGLVCHHSGYFRGAFQGGFREAKKRVVVLDTESIEVFDVVFRWLYRGKLLDTEPDEDSLKNSDVWLLLINVYIFADTRCMPSLGDAVIDQLHRSTCVAATIYPARQIDHLYADTPAKSSIRSFMVDLWISPPNDHKSSKELLKSINAIDFVEDIVLATAKKDWKRFMTREEWEKVDTCRYHDHRLLRVEREAPEVIQLDRKWQFSKVNPH